MKSVDKEKLIKVVADLYIEGKNVNEIVRILSEKCQNDKNLLNCKIPSERTIRRWIKKHQSEWDLKRKQKEILKVEKNNKENAALLEKIQTEIDKADAIDYEDLCELQQAYKEIALNNYKPRAVEVVISCIKLKREIREGMRPQNGDNAVKIILTTPEKSQIGWEIEEEND